MGGGTGVGVGRWPVKHQVAYLRIDIGMDVHIGMCIDARTGTDDGWDWWVVGW